MPTTAASTTVVSGTQITTSTPELVSGLADVVVVNPDGQVAVLAQGFLYTPPPQITGILPPQGSTLGGDTIAITGTGFQPNAQILIGGKLATDVVVHDSGNISATTPSGTAGPASVTVKNPDLSSHTVGGGFLYIKPPKIVNLFPSLGPETGGTIVTIQGDGFVTGPTKSVVHFGNTVVAANKTSVDNANLITVESPPGTGPVAVRIVNPDGQQAVLAGGFIYIPVIPAPTVTAILPTFGLTGGGYLLQVIGDGFLEGAQLSFGNDAIGYTPAILVKVKNAGTLITATAPAHLPGLVNVKVTNSDGQFGVLQSGFEFIQPLGLPGLAFNAVVPDRGPPAGGYDVVISGQGFKSGIQVFFGHEAGATWVPATAVVRLGPTLLRVTVPNVGQNGKFDVRLSNPAVAGNPDELIATEAFTFGQAAIFDPKGHRLPIDILTDDRHVGLVDVNGDGLNDVVVTHVHGPIELFINTVDENGVPGKFLDQTEKNMPAIGNYHNAWLPRALDVDGDGDLDILVVHGWSQAQNLGYYRNAGDGTFTFVDAGGHGVANPADMEIGDLNCDGHPDVFLSNPNGRNAIMVGDGTGTFRLAPDTVLPNHSEPSRGIQLGDVDNDGDLDVVVANANSLQNRLYYNNCNNTPLPPSCSFDVTNCEMFGYEGHRYAACNNETQNWANAENRCRTGGMHLATINDQTEQDFLNAKMSSHWWMSLKETSDVWAWPWSPSTFTNWCANQPDQAGDQCAHTNQSSNCWDDPGCGSGYRFICESESADACPAAWQFTAATTGPGKNFPISGFNSQDVVLADVDSDGFLDVVMINDGQSNAVYFNDGGNFLLDNGLSFPQEGEANRSVEAWGVDVDQDNDIDIVIRKILPNGQYWPYVYLNDGTGTFSDASAVNVPAQRGEDSIYMTVGDMNGDSLPDIYIVNKDHQDWLLLNHGWGENLPMLEQNRVPIGAFANNTMFGVPEDVGDSYVAVAGDIDDDGDLDLVIGYESVTWNSTIWINDSKGNFFDQGPVRLPELNCAVRGMDLADINGDGDLDLLVTCASTGKRLLVNDGGGFFTDVSKNNVPGWSSGGYAGSGAADLDGDGDIDWLLASSGSSASWGTFINGGDVYDQDGAYFIQRNDLLDPGVVQYPQCPNCAAQKSMAIAQLNGDNALDLYLGHSGQNLLYHNDGTGFFVNVTPSHMPAISDTTNFVVAADVDGDGDRDLFVFNSGQNRLHLAELDFKYADVTASNLLLQNGDPYVLNDNSTWGGAGDFDMDGFVDFVASNWGQQNTLMLNKGGAVFEDFTAFSMPRDADPSRCVVVADLDGDGVLDLFFANRQVNRVYLNKTPKPPGWPAP